MNRFEFIWLTLQNLIQRLDVILKVSETSRKPTRLYHLKISHSFKIKLKQQTNDQNKF